MRHLLILLLALLCTRLAAQVVSAAEGSAALVSIRVLSSTHGAAELELAWARSWRDPPGSPRGNHDGVWLFGKWQDEAGRWRHLPLQAEAVEGFEVQAVARRGALVARREAGHGEARGRLRIAWTLPATPRQVRLQAWPMVHVRGGPFFAGDGAADTPGRWHDGADPARPFRIDGSPIELGQRAAALWADTTRSPLPSGLPGPAPWDGASGALPAAFPTGYGAFWIQRYETTQGQYADFLNTLSPQQAAARAPGAADFAGTRSLPGHYRFSLAQREGLWQAAQPRWSMNWLTWEDGTALADWAGLRPMSELEFEQAARGPLPPVPGEYAWGTTRIVAIRGFDGEDGSGRERALPPDANTSWSPTAQDRPLLGPYAAAALAGRATREGRGESFWGVADLSGNLVEMAVSAGNPAGRAFVPNHGDGELDEGGRADVPGWPGMGPRSAAFSPVAGFGYRGGDFYNPERDLRTSSRNVATFGGTRRLFGLGFRGVLGPLN